MHVLVCILAAVLVVAALSTSVSMSVDPPRHLVVLIHGLLGTERDLEYLALGLRKLDYVVLPCKSNGGLRSFDGIRAGALRVLEEIFEIETLHPDLTHISFVGLSLGGLYARYAVYLMSTHLPSKQSPELLLQRLDAHSDPDLNTHLPLHLEGYLSSGRDSSLSLQPGLFLCIASPFLGVRDHSYIEDGMKRYFGEGGRLSSVPFVVKRLIAAAMAQTGAEVFLLDRVMANSSGHDRDDANITHSLLYSMATSPQFLMPLKMFARRRLYANLDHDFMVSPSTGAFLGGQVVRELRQKYVYNDSSAAAVLQESVAHHIEGEGETCELFSSSSTLAFMRHIVAACDSTATSRDTSKQKNSEYKNEHERGGEAYVRMRRGLNSLGWDKFIVLFPTRFPYVPLAHNQLPALRKFPDIIFSRLLGCSEGESVMDHALDFLRGLETSRRERDACREEGEGGGALI